MTSSGAHQAVLVSLAASGAIVTVSALAQGNAPRPRTIIGGGFAFVVLGFLADAAPELAGMLALLILASVVLADGGKFFKLIGGSTK